MLPMPEVVVVALLAPTPAQNVVAPTPCALTCHATCDLSVGWSAAIAVLTATSASAMLIICAHTRGPSMPMPLSLLQPLRLLRLPHQLSLHDLLSSPMLARPRSPRSDKGNSEEVPAIGMYCCASHWLSTAPSTTTTTIPQRQYPINFGGTFTKQDVVPHGGRVITHFVVRM